MTDIVSPILQWLNAHPQLAGLATFLISATESVAIIGTIVPGSIMMTAIGTLAGAGIIPLWPTIFWAILGAIAGDGISYWIGYTFKARLPNLWLFRIYPTLLPRGEKFFHKYGYMSVFIGRFIGPVRALVPLVAGMLGMKPLQFTIANVTSAIGWAPAYMLPGIILGAASLELPPDIAMHVIIATFLILLFILLCLWFIYKSFQLLRHQTHALQVKTWQWMKKNRYLSPITYLLKHHDPKNKAGQLNLGIYFLITSFLFVTLVLYVKYKSPTNIGINDAIFHLFRGVRLASLDDWVLNITLLGQKEIALVIVLALVAWLFISKQWRAACHALALGLLAAGGIFMTKHLAHVARPWGIATHSTTFSMPSGHTVMATALYMGLAFLIARALPVACRSFVYGIGALIAFAVGISRLYLGAHWFTDVVSGWLLSTAILMLVIISYQRSKEDIVKLRGILFITLLSLVSAFYVYHVRHFAEMKTNYAPLDWPTAMITTNEWWGKNDALPAYRASLFGFPSQKINVAWAGTLDQIHATLLHEGWSKPPPRDWISTLHRISGVDSTLYLPLVSPQYLDKTPALTMTRITGKKNMLVIRLWDAHRILKESNSTLWVGIISIVPRSYSWLYKKNLGEIEINPVLVFPTQDNNSVWQWKSMVVHLPTGTHRIIQQKILLIKHKTSHH